MRKRRLNNTLVSFGSWSSYDEEYRESLKSRRNNRVQPSLPVSVIEFQEQIERHYLDWMNPVERDGYRVLLGLLRGESFNDVSKDIGKDVGYCRKAVGEFGNLFSTTATNDLFMWLPREISSALACEPTWKSKHVSHEWADKKAAHHEEVIARGGGPINCPTYVPTRPVTNVSNSLADEVLKQMMRHPATKYAVQWACSRGVEREEAVQEIMISMWDALRSFDPEIAPLDQYLLHCARKRLASRVNRDKKIRRRLREVSFHENAIQLKPRPGIPSEEALTERASRIRSLTAMEMRAMRKRANGFSLKEIGAGMEFGSTKAVDNALCRISKKMRAEGSDFPFA